ncbi:M23 family metallopeptidase [Altererythrobacter sp.]|uniref:M23 family metallopeptidase n=1 Tax=Altererythrobacter sp. TaxID=1872480 RepID=UPI003D07ABD2
MRSQGQVRFIKISSRLQIGAAIVTLALLAGWGISMAGMAWVQYRAQADRLSLIEREARVATASERVDAYRHDIDAVAQDLVKRQEFLEQMTQSLPDDIRSKGTVTDSSNETASTIKKVSASIPEATALAQIEARQLAFVERLTRYADRRAKRAEHAMIELGLDPRAMLRNAERQAMGGPLEILATSANGDLDPRFERLGLSLARMNTLERSLDSVPQVLPTNGEMVTSSYGIRRDPFTRRPAMHSGLDFKGRIGSPIYAAAKGRISFVGRKSGYGKVVEVSHGNGLLTRYAHMSKFHARVGQQVASGDVIGAIGSTGRSTGPHLHFEVRINNRAVNPRLFLEKAPDVLKEVRRIPQLAKR